MNEDIDDLLERCENLYDEGRYEEIVAICDEILEKDMNSEIALGHKANALGFLERDDEAL